jgi:hypothetical protein
LYQNNNFYGSEIKNNIFFNNGDHLHIADFV